METRLFSWLSGSIFPAVYEGDTVPAAGANDTLAGNLDDLPDDAKGKTNFTQEELNAILKKDRLKHKTQIDKERADKATAIKNLESLQKSKGLTEQEKAQLQTQIDDMKNSLLTEQQKAEREKKGLQAKYDEDTKKLAGERDSWQQRFNKQTISNAIINASVEAEAFDPEDLIARLAPDTKLVQEQDADGNPTERFVPKVKFSDTDKEGKTVVIEYSVADAVKRMKELDKFKHLFKTAATGGLGGNSGANNAGKKGKDPKDMTQAEYLKHRQTVGLGRKPAGK